MVGYDDSTIDFFEVSAEENPKLNRVGYCTKVPGPVLQMDWSTNDKYIKVKLFWFLIFFSSQQFNGSYSRWVPIIIIPLFMRRLLVSKLKWKQSATRSSGLNGQGDLEIFAIK